MVVLLQRLVLASLLRFGVPGVGGKLVDKRLAGGMDEKFVLRKEGMHKAYTRKDVIVCFAEGKFMPEGCDTEGRSRRVIVDGLRRRGQGLDESLKVGDMFFISALMHGLGRVIVVFAHYIVRSLRIGIGYGDKACGIGSAVVYTNDVPWRFIRRKRRVGGDMPGLIEGVKHNAFSRCPEALNEAAIP